MKNLGSTSDHQDVGKVGLGIASASVGKIVNIASVDANGNPTGYGVTDGLPSVTSSDNGKVLKVANSEWSASSLSASDVGAQAAIAANGILKGDGAGNITAAVAGTDYISGESVEFSVLVANYSEFDGTSDNQVPTSKAAKTYIDGIVGDIESALAALR